MEQLMKEKIQKQKNARQKQRAQYLKKLLKNNRKQNKSQSPAKKYDSRRGIPQYSQQVEILKLQRLKKNIKKQKNVQFIQKSIYQEKKEQRRLEKIDKKNQMKEEEYEKKLEKIVEFQEFNEKAIQKQQEWMQKKKEVQLKKQKEQESAEQQKTMQIKNYRENIIPKKLGQQNNIHQKQQKINGQINSLLENSQIQKVILKNVVVFQQLFKQLVNVDFTPLNTKGQRTTISCVALMAFLKAFEMSPQIVQQSQVYLIFNQMVKNKSSFQGVQEGIDYKEFLGLVLRIAVLGENRNIVVGVDQKKQNDFQNDNEFDNMDLNQSISNQNINNNQNNSQMYINISNILLDGYEEIEKYDGNKFQEFLKQVNIEQNFKNTVEVDDFIKKKLEQVQVKSNKIKKKDMRRIENKPQQNILQNQQSISNSFQHILNSETQDFKQEQEKSMSNKKLEFDELSNQNNNEFKDQQNNKQKDSGKGGPQKSQTRNKENTKFSKIQKVASKKSIK